jgi:hypothetical protein
MPSPAIKFLVMAAMAACSAAALAGCEEQSYPTPSVEQAPPPPPPPAPLMGAPMQTPPPPYAPCAQNPCGSTAQPVMAPRVIASTPVPNPPEMEHHHRRHPRLWMSSEATPVAPHHHVGQHYSDGRWHVVGPAAAPQVASAPSAAPAAAHPHHQTAAAKPNPATAPHRGAGSVAKVAPPAAGHTIGNIADNSTGASSGADADRYNSLQSALSNLIGVDGALSAPDHFQAGQTVDVSLTLPANFAQQAHDEAAKAGLADAAGSVNIDAHLTGTGFTIVPDQAQAQPLLLGQPTVFHWKVTPTSAAVGAVKADLTADLLTVGKSLPLGSVQSQTSISGIHLSGRLIGVGLLILVLVIVAAWLVSRTSTSPPFRRRDI